jgi:hypothetical protein
MPSQSMGVGLGGSSNDPNDLVGDTPRAYQAFGSTMKAVPLFPLHASSVASLTSQRGHFIAVYNPIPQLITGVAFYQGSAGVFDGNNFNGFALFSLDPVTGTCTKQLETTNDPDHFKNTSNSWRQVPFTTPTVMPVGGYFVAALWSSSSTTTSPTLGIFSSLTNSAAGLMLLPNSGRITGAINGLLAFPASFGVSTLIGSTTPYVFYLY